MKTERIKSLIVRLFIVNMIFNILIISFFLYDLNKSIPKRECTVTERVEKVIVELMDRSNTINYPLNSEILCEDSNGSIDIEVYEALGHKNIFAFNTNPAVCLIKYYDEVCEIK